MNTLIAQAAAEGWSIPTTQGHLHEVFQQWMAGDLTPEEFEWFDDRLPSWRTEMIARTETIRASNYGTVGTFNALGVLYKEWIVTDDDRLCPWCASMEGTIIKTNDYFFQQGSQLTVDVDGSPRALQLNYEDVTGPPLHPFCRCSLVPVI